MAQEIQIFNNPEFGEIRTAGTSEEPLFCASDLCRALGYANSRDAISKHVDEGDVAKRDTPTSSGVQSMVFVNESGMYALVFGSKQPNAKSFKRWVTKEVLPSLRKHGAYTVRKESSTTSLTPTKVRASLEWVRGVSDLLNLNDSSKLTLITKVAQPLGLPVPDYTPSHGILKSATELLKENGIHISVQDFNKRLMEHGYIVTLMRKSSGGKEKPFKSITEKGLPYGENQVNPNNPKSTQPLWYADKFMELAELVGINVMVEA